MVATSRPAGAAPPPPAAAAAAAPPPVDYTHLLETNAEENGLTQFAAAFTLPNGKATAPSFQAHQAAAAYAHDAVSTRLTELHRTVSNGTDVSNFVDVFFYNLMPTMFIVTTPPLLARMAIQGLVPPFSFNASGTRYNVTLRAITDAERATMDNDDGSRTDRKALTTCSIVAPPTPASRMDQSAEMKSEITLDFAKQQFAITGEIGQATDGAQKFPTYYVNFTKAGDVLNAAGLHLLHEKGIVGPSSNVKYDIKWNKDLLSDLGLCAVCAASDICDHGRGGGKSRAPPAPSGSGQQLKRAREEHKKAAKRRIKNGTR